MARLRNHLPHALVLLIIGAGCGLAGCAGPTRQRAVPLELQDRALIPGLTPAVRTWGSGLNPEFHRELLESVRREQAYRASTGQHGPLPPAEFLAISGGGQNGAFTAGLLCGWTAAGNRPVFKAVTGISTGALIAPFAFLGPKYDETLRRVYTRVRTRDILTPRPLLAALFSDALADNRPLWRLLESVVDQKLVDEIAAEYAKGRVLFIGTTNLDARRAVIWNVTAIAASGSPRALELIRSIMIASAAIPAAFPPVFIEVAVDGGHYYEMHVDGGAMTQVFLYPPSVKLKEQAAAAGIVRERRAYIIRNARLDPDWAQTERRTLKIAARAIDALLATQGVGDLYRTYLNTQRDGVDYNLAFIPPTFKCSPKEAFDMAYMNELFKVGYDLARGGYPWQKAPPSFETPEGVTQ
ncbi:MAG: patatin-like phospholipase family protein [Planctomycetota bacterium]